MTLVLPRENDGSITPGGEAGQLSSVTHTDRYHREIAQQRGYCGGREKIIKDRALTVTYLMN